MGKVRKITFQIQEDLLTQAQSASGKGITETIRQGLQLVAARKAYQALRSWKGKVKFSLDLKSV